MAVTKKDIAEHLGISRSTVSFVLNNTPNVKVAEKTRTLILQTAQELGYWNNEISPKLCFILYDREGDDPRYMVNLGIVAEAAEQYQYQLLFKSLKANVQEYPKLVKFLQEQKVSGLIVTGAVTDTFIDMIVETGIPCVFWGGTYREDIRVAVNDHKKAAYEATRHLLSLNHKKIAFFTGALHLSVHKLELEGYMQALSEEGIAIDKSLIQVSKEESGYELCRRMEELDIEYTAAFCVNSVIQFGVLQRLKESGVHVPEEVSLIGYEFTDLVRASVPQLTVIYMDRREKLAIVTKLMDVIRKKDVEPKSLLFSQFQIFAGGTASICRGRREL